MRERGYQLTRFADDWVVTCETAKQAKEVLAAAQHILSALGVELHPQKTRIVHVRYGFEFLGYKIKQGARPLYLPANKIRSGVQHGALYAYPRDRSIQRFMDQVRRLTRRKVPLTTSRADQRAQPDPCGLGALLQARPRATTLPPARRLDRATPMVASVQAVAQRWLETASCERVVWRVRSGELDRIDTFDCCLAQRINVKAACGKTARAVWAADGGQRASAPPPTRQPYPRASGNTGRCRGASVGAQAPSQLELCGARARGQGQPRLPAVHAHRRGQGTRCEDIGPIGAGAGP